MNNYEDQMNQFREHMARSGFSGTAIIDVHPSAGIIRIKVNTTPPQNLKPFTTGWAQMLNIMLTASNIEAKMHVSEEN
jgi:hypothetical protein